MRYNGLVIVVALIFYILLGSYFVNATEAAVTILPPDEIIVIYDEFKDSPGTTDFDSMSETELMTITDMTLENEIYGKIVWLDIIDLTLVAPGNRVDLDKNIEIDDKLIFVNTTNFTNLASNVNLTYYGIEFIEPQILRNELICGDPDCVVLEYYPTTGLFVFNATLTPPGEITFKVREKPGEPPPSGPPGNGGPGPKSKVLNFSLSTDLIEVGVLQGNSISRSFVIENTGEVNLPFTISTENLGRFMTFSEDTFTLNVHERKPLDAIFTIFEDEEVAVHTGTIRVRGSSILKMINVILRVIGDQVLFDLKSELIDTTLTQRQLLVARVTMTDISSLGKVNVLLEYFVKDFDGNEIQIAEETIDVVGELEIERGFNLPIGVRPGEYVFVVKLTYQDDVATSANPFRVINVLFFYTLWIIIIIILICVTVAYLIYYSRRDKEKEKKAHSLVKKEKLKKNKVKGGVVLLKSKDEENKSKIIKRYIRELIRFN